MLLRDLGCGSGQSDGENSRHARTVSVSVVLARYTLNAGHTALTDALVLLKRLPMIQMRDVFWNANVEVGAALSEDQTRVV